MPIAQLRPVEPQLHQRLRLLAHERLDAEIFDHLFTLGGDTGLAAEDAPIVAAVLREAARQFSHHARFGKPDREIERIVEFVETLLANAVLPASAGSPGFREYVGAVIDWNAALRESPYEERFWPMLEALLAVDMAALPDLHERLIGLCAEYGGAFPAVSAVEGALDDFVRRPYRCSDPNSVLVGLGGALGRIIGDSDFRSATERWLALWRYHLGQAKVSRKLRRDRLLRLRQAVHRRLGLLFRLDGLLAGRHGNRRTTITLLLVKFDLFVFLRSRLAQTPIGRAWLALLCGIFRRLGARGDIDAETHAVFLGVPAQGLAIRAPPLLIGTGRDVVVTRAQGGLGDILMMRPGLIALARRVRRRGGRVIFATNRAFFPVFSTDDPIELADIEHTEIDVTSFGAWHNLTECPADAREFREFPRIRTNRIEIFGRAMGAGLPRWTRDRACPIRFPELIAQAAGAFIRERARPGLRCIGVQLRAAETYRDVPALLDAARLLAERYNVFVFDNRPIPRRPDDRFIAVDDQSLRVAMAIVVQMDAVVAPDSVYVHLAGANRIPCLALFGPTGGKIRTRGYPSVRVLDASDTLACIPCWRNEYVRCGIGRGFDSVCMGLLTAPVIVAAVEDLLAGAQTCVAGNTRRAPLGAADPTADPVAAPQPAE